VSLAYPRVYSSCQTLSQPSGSHEIRPECGREDDVCGYYITGLIGVAWSAADSIQEVAGADRV
jgi:hypothetical protein